MSMPWLSCNLTIAEHDQHTPDRDVRACRDPHPAQRTPRLSLSLELVITMMCGLGFYAGFVAGDSELDERAPIRRQFMSKDLWGRLSRGDFAVSGPHS